MKGIGRIFNMMVKKGSDYFICASSICQPVKDIQDDPVVLVGKCDHVIVGFFRIKFHAMQGIGDHYWAGIIDEDKLPILLLKLNTEVWIPLHGGIYSMTQYIRVDQIPHPYPDPNFVGVFPVR